MRNILLYAFFIVASLILFSLELFIGSVSIPPGSVFDILTGNYTENVSWNVIVLETRLPRAIAALVAGIFLSLSGLLMQTLFRNPLAGPHILGVSSGSSLGVAIVIMGFEIFSIHPGIMTNFIVVAAAFAGAFVILAILFFISMVVSDILTVLIFGVLLSAISLALVGILQYLSPEGMLKAFLVWTLGSFDAVEYSESMILLASLVPMIIFLLFLFKPLNLLLVGDDEAMSLGLRPMKSRLLIMLVAGMMTALVTAYCGPIGFVGVVVPHFARLIFKTFDHRKLSITSMLIGVNVMLFSDLLAHLPGSDHILPVNSITSLIGIPFIFWMLLKRKNITAL